MIGLGYCYRVGNSNADIDIKHEYVVEEPQMSIDTDLTLDDFDLSELDEKESR